LNIDVGAIALLVSIVIFVGVSLVTGKNEISAQD